MLLKALYDFAHSRRLLGDLAFAPKAIRWVIQLDAEGNLLGVLDTSEDGKYGKTFESVPKVSGSKNAGGVAEFLADRLTALLGVEQEPEKLSSEETPSSAR
jgi:CRISPR-associated protein Csd1